ncbi:MAG: hypothetical protein ACI8QF_002200, partial [Limisphaerales bacterium]
WTGEEMVVYGGNSLAGPSAAAAAYNPETDSWRALTSEGSPEPRSGARAIWTGTEMLVFGGIAGSQRLAALQRLQPGFATYLYKKL